MNSNLRFSQSLKNIGEIMVGANRFELSVRPAHQLAGVTKSCSLFVATSPSCSPAGCRLDLWLLAFQFRVKNGRGEQI